MQFRELTAEDIEVRVQQVKDNHLVLLLYKNARVDMNILDETVGPENWQREHYECKGNLFCRVGINIKHSTTEEPVWVWKSDCGTESNTEAEKGEASDSFKRACFNWGIGRELYTSPFIRVIPEQNGQTVVNIKKNSKGQPVCYDKFFVGKIEIKNGKIVSLVIGDANTKKWCFSWQKN